MFWSVSGAWPRQLPDSCPSLAAAMQVKVRRVEELVPELPPAFAGVINVALDADPDARWPSARAMKEKLTAARSPLQHRIDVRALGVLDT
jgi:hypothetical protein